MRSFRSKWDAFGKNGRPPFNERLAYGRDPAKLLCTKERSFSFPPSQHSFQPAVPLLPVPQRRTRHAPLSIHNKVTWYTLVKSPYSFAVATLRLQLPSNCSRGTSSKVRQACC